MTIQTEAIMQITTIPDKALKYILFQRSAYFSLLNNKAFRVVNKITPGDMYRKAASLEALARGAKIKKQYAEDMLSEYNDILASLPHTCTSILDIGCGIAGIDVLLNQHYKPSQSPDFFLLDKSKTDDKLFYGFKDQASFYNSLELANDFLVANDISSDRIHLVEVTPDNAINIDQTFDLIISLISWGFHYPVQTYIKRVHDLLNDQGRLILDIRKNQDGESVLKDFFPSAAVISETAEKSRWLAIKQS